MKTHFGSMAFLIAGILFLGIPLGASGAATNASATDKQLRAMQKQREQLDALSTQLNELLTKYTEKDKKVRAMRKQIADLQKQLASESAATLPAAASGSNRTPRTSDATAKSTNAPARGSIASAYGADTMARATNAAANTKAAANTNTNAPTNVGLLISTAMSGTNATASTNVSVNLVSMETLDDKYRLAIGDKLSFRIEEDKNRLDSGDKQSGLSVHTDDEPTPLLVTDSGELEVPYIGRYSAENKTCKQLAYELKTALEKDYFYKATVILAVDLKAKSQGRVYLTGAVHEPGPQEIPSDEVLTLGKAILRAGGFTDFAERTNVKVTRKAVGSSEIKTLVVDVAVVFDKGKTDRDLPLEPGDLIMVPERLIRF